MTSELIPGCVHLKLYLDFRWIHWYRAVGCYLWISELRLRFRVALAAGPQIASLPGRVDLTIAREGCETQIKYHNLKKFGRILAV